MRVLYWIRVFFVSVEALCLLLALVLWIHQRPLLATIAAQVKVDEDLRKYLLFVPIGLGAWIATDLRQLLHEDKEQTRLLTTWPDYWRLKAHFWSTLLYMVLFAVVGIVPWVLPMGIAAPGGLLLFCLGLIGQVSVAITVYVARVRLKEVTAKLTTGDKPAK